jgi:hypothetical protein
MTVEDGQQVNLDPRNCDCGKGSACPLITPEWATFLKRIGVDLDAWTPTWEHVPTFAVVDLRDGYLTTRDDRDNTFPTREVAEAYARLRNEGLYVAAQTYRVVEIKPVPFADVKPRPLGG